MSTLNNQTALNTADPLVRMYHLTCALGLCEAAIYSAVKKGQLPKADFGGSKGSTRVVQWRLSTLRASNPPLADTVEQLLKIPRIAAV